MKSDLVCYTNIGFSMSLHGSWDVRALWTATFTSTLAHLKLLHYTRRPFAGFDNFKGYKEMKDFIESLEKPRCARHSCAQVHH